MRSTQVSDWNSIRITVESKPKISDSGYTKIRDSASRKDPSRDTGHRPQNTGHPGKYRTVGNPTLARQVLVNNSKFKYI